MLLWMDLPESLAKCFYLEKHKRSVELIIVPWSADSHHLFTLLLVKTVLLIHNISTRTCFLLNQLTFDICSFAWYLFLKPSQCSVIWPAKYCWCKEIICYVKYVIDHLNVCCYSSSRLGMVFFVKMTPCFSCFVLPSL